MISSYRHLSTHIITGSRAQPLLPLEVAYDFAPFGEVPDQQLSELVVYAQAQTHRRHDGPALPGDGCTAEEGVKPG